MYPSDTGSAESRQIQTGDPNRNLELQAPAIKREWPSGTGHRKLATGILESQQARDLRSEPETGIQRSGYWILDWTSDPTEQVETEDPKPVEAVHSEFGLWNGTQIETLDRKL